MKMKPSHGSVRQQQQVEQSIPSLVVDPPTEQTDDESVEIRYVKSGGVVVGRGVST